MVVEVGRPALAILATVLLLATATAHAQLVEPTWAWAKTDKAIFVYMHTRGYQLGQQLLELEKIDVGWSIVAMPRGDINVSMDPLEVVLDYAGSTVYVYYNGSLIGSAQYNEPLDIVLLSISSVSVEGVEFQLPGQVYAGSQTTTITSSQQVVLGYAYTHTGSSISMLADPSLSNSTLQSLGLQPPLSQPPSTQDSFTLVGIPWDKPTTVVPAEGQACGVYVYDRLGRLSTYLVASQPLEVNTSSAVIVGVESPCTYQVVALDRLVMWANPRLEATGEKCSYMIEVNGTGSYICLPRAEALVGDELGPWYISVAVVDSENYTSISVDASRLGPERGTPPILLLYSSGLTPVACLALGQEPRVSAEVNITGVELYAVLYGFDSSDISRPPRIYRSLLELDPARYGGEIVMILYLLGVAPLLYTLRGDPKSLGIGLTIYAVVGVIVSSLLGVPPEVLVPAATLAIILAAILLVSTH